jgi:hypothetical protein
MNSEYIRASLAIMPPTFHHTAFTTLTHLLHMLTTIASGMVCRGSPVGWVEETWGEAGGELVG